MRVSARSLSVHLAWLLTTPPLPCRVLSVHARACNLLTADNRLIALVHPDPGDGPFHIVLSTPAPFDVLLAPGDEGHVAAGRLRVGPLDIALTDATLWSPQVPWGTGDSRRALTVAVLNEVLASARPSRDPTALAARAIILAARAALVAGIAAQDEGATRAGLARVLGLGPGLTPAGDDLVLGVLAGVWAWDEWSQVRAWLARLVEVVARSRTHRLSREWLGWAARNAFARPWHHLAAGMARADATAIRQAGLEILHTGASSGEYALWGFLAVTAHPKNI